MRERIVGRNAKTQFRKKRSDQSNGQSSQIKAKQSLMKCRVFITLLRCTRWLWFLSWWIKFRCTIILMKPVFVTKTIWQHLDLHSQGQTHSFQWDWLLVIPSSTNLANFLPFVSTVYRRNSSGWLNHDEMLLSSREKSSAKAKKRINIVPLCKTRIMVFDR